MDSRRYHERDGSAIGDGFQIRTLPTPPPVSGTVDNYARVRTQGKDKGPYRWETCRKLNTLRFNRHRNLMISHVRRLGRSLHQRLGKLIHIARSLSCSLRSRKGGLYPPAFGASLHTASVARCATGNRSGMKFKVAGEDRYQRVRNRQARRSIDSHRPR
jgi:hypothetical protein